MATTPLAPQQNTNSQEPTADAPAQQASADAILQKYGKKLIELAIKKRNSWEWKRRGIVLKILKNKEMLKGNQRIGFYPGTFDAFDAFDEYYNFTGADPKKEDKTIDRRPHNFYQMVEKAFVSGLASGIPKVRAMPANADNKDDRETAKVFSRIEEIIERANKIKRLVKRELMELFTAGSYFKHTRYVVDSRRTGTHKQPMYSEAQGEIFPARYLCFNCGQSTSEDDLVNAGKGLACPNCGAPLSEENYFSNDNGVTVQTQEVEVPNGMVLWDVFSGLHVDADPEADGLINVGLLNVAQEVPLGWIRTAFPQMWKSIEPGMTGGASSELLERQYRSMLSVPSGYSLWMNYSQNDKPTYNRTWFQPEVFAEIDGGEQVAKELQQAFPDGCMLAYVGAEPLQIRKAKLTDEWTWCGSDDGFGLYPPPIGDPAVPIQERLNDVINKIDEYMDRLACGILLANEQYISTRALNGKQMLPGILNPVAFKQNTPANITELIYQVKGEIDAQIFTYVATLKQDLELLVGTPPQTFGGGTQNEVDTFGGQKLQLDSGMMKMGLAWDWLREEHAEAAENAVKCASQNMTEDWKDTVADESSEYVNEYVHMDQVKGSVRVEPDSDQSFPMSYSDIKAWYKDLFANADNAFAQMFLDEPENVDNAMRYVAPPGAVAPGAAMRNKMLRNIDKLVKGAPVPQTDPITGKQVMIPSVVPNKWLDDLPASMKIVENWTQAHWDKVESNKPALDNLIAYYRMCAVMQKEKQAELQLMGGPDAPPPNVNPKSKERKPVTQ